MTRAIALALFLCYLTVSVSADEPAAEKKSPTELSAQYKKLEATLTDAKLVGNFTITGKDTDKLTKEEYTIVKAKKMEAGDLWIIEARIKYGDKDLTVPLPLDIKWAGDTPVITLTKFTIPGMGTFSSRVLLYEGRYAGTWQHDAVGGHLFGTIEKAKAE